MNYIYKIVGNFTDDNIQKILKKTSNDFVSIYIDKILFLSLKTITKEEECKKVLDKVFRPIRDFYIEEINETNVNTLSPFIKEWCLNNFVRLDTEKYESEHQEELINIWKSLDEFEEKLKDKINNNRKEV